MENLLDDVQRPDSAYNKNEHWEIIFTMITDIFRTIVNRIERSQRRT